MRNIFSTLIAFLALTNAFGQDPYWKTTGNFINGLGDRFLGTTDQASLRFKTEGIHLASFTYGNSLNAPVAGGTGDGLRIFNATLPTDPNGVLDLFTTSGNKTHVQFSSDGSINGRWGRMDYIAHGQGFWLNTSKGSVI